MKFAARYIYPPRSAKGSTPRDQLAPLKKYGWKAQCKLNDKRLCLSIDDGKITFYNRHNAIHKTYTPPTWLQEEILQACQILGLTTDDEWQYLDGGLLHGKHKHFADTIAIWDILVRNSEWLLNTTYQERYDSLIAKLVEHEHYIITIGGKQFDLGIKITEHIFIPHLYDDYDEVWKIVDEANAAAGWKGEGEALLEGCVLKQPSGKLTPGFRPDNNSAWQTRSRIQTGRSNF